MDLRIPGSRSSAGRRVGALWLFALAPCAAPTSMMTRLSDVVRGMIATDNRGDLALRLGAAGWRVAHLRWGPVAK